MRRAAILAGFIPNTPAGRSRVHFVTEGEASIHYCVGNNYASDMINVGGLFFSTCQRRSSDHFRVCDRVAKASSLLMPEEGPSI
jgi:hypothetical protein